MALPLFSRSQALPKLYRAMFSPLLERYDLTQMEADILLFLANNPDLDTARDMVEKRHLAKSHVSAGIDALTRRGLVERFYWEGNRKVIHLRLLPASAEIVAEGRSMQRRYWQLLFRGFSQAEQAQLTALLERIAENAEAALAAQEERNETLAL